MKTSVLLCGQRLPSGFADSRRGNEPPITIVDDLCRDPAQIGQLIDGADRLVLGVCLSEVSVGAVQAEARHAGIDPLGIEVIDLESVSGQSDRLPVVVNAKVARADAFAGSRPEHAKLSFPANLSRRDLLHRRIHQYIPAPAINHSTCAASSGCRACVDICPQQALSWSGGVVSYDRIACEPCGRCVTTCPTGAVVNPGATRAQLKAEISAMLDPSIGPTGPRGIAFTCSRGDDLFAPSRDVPGWYTVSVPCVGMATPALLLAPLLMGAGNVVASPCHDTGCPLGHSRIVEETVDFCRSLLSAAGESPERVSLTPASDILLPLPAVELPQPFGPDAAVQIVEAFGALSSSPSAIAFDHEMSPLGIIDIDEKVCTACTTCAQTCPTQALQFIETPHTVSISFDASYCVACGQCTARCPELDSGAIALHRRTDWSALETGRVELMQAEVLHCESCDAPIAPLPALERISALLEPENEAMAQFLQRRCLDCRSQAPVG